jgi:hypothetical protein
MQCASLSVHANNDTEETTEFRHEGILASRQEQIMRPVLSGTLRASLRICM